MNHYLLHLVGLTFIYLEKMHGHPYIKNDTGLAVIFKELSQHFPEWREKRHEDSRSKNCDFRPGACDYQLQGIREEEALSISRHNPHIRVQLLNKTTKPPKRGIR
jgi:hypothetical protein